MKQQYNGRKIYGMKFLTFAYIFIYDKKTRCHEVSSEHSVIPTKKDTSKLLIKSFKKILFFLNTYTMNKKI